MRKVSLAALTLLAGGTALASSHREAPAIAKDPAADITDVYTFRNANNDGQVFVMNVSPGYLPVAGPNWYGFDDEVLYEMHVDNTGDASEDVTYQFKFTTTDYRGAKGFDNLIVSYFPLVKWDNTKKMYTGAVGVNALTQTYTVTKIAGKRRTGTATAVAFDGGATAYVAPPRIGPRSTDGSTKTFPAGADPESATDMYNGYKDLASHAVMTAGNAKFFAGPRNDPFFVDLGAIFDAVSPRIPTGTAGYDGTARDALKGINVLSIVFEVPDADVFATACTDATGCENFISVWATSSRPQAKVLKTKGEAPVLGGGYVQISRLANPLVNEVVMKVADKDKFNFTEPKDDVANYAVSVIQPQLAFVMNQLYGRGDNDNSLGINRAKNGSLAQGVFTHIDEGADSPTAAEARADLVDVFVAGIGPFNRHPKSAGLAANGTIPALTGSGDMIRVNKSLGAGFQHWPVSGRALGDDVVATALQFLANCRWVHQFATDPYSLPNSSATAAEKGYDVQEVWKKGDGTTSFHAVDFPDSIAVPVPANCIIDDFVQKGDKTDGSASDTGVLTEFPYVDLPHSSYGARVIAEEEVYP